MKRILVTGSSRGIGRAIALKLAADGFAIGVHCRSRREEAEAVAAEIQAKGGRAWVLQFDVCDRAATRAVLEADLEANGYWWGIVCNAGVTRDNTFPALSDEDWDVVIDTDLNGFFNVVQPLVMPLVRAKKGGRIVTLASVSGVIGNRGQVNYSAAKGGLIAASKALALELATRKITVNCIAPGLIASDMLDSAPVDEALKYVPMGRVGQPEEVAATVAFLMSEGAGYITRQVIGVNGGMA
ncbi:MAG: short chain dehydrogenase family protein [Proteobacteria bacterium]|nr:short chain dehydrogenase family protein [Pseudomonadota bacterium]